MFPAQLNFHIKNGALVVKDLPPHLHLRGMGYTSQKLADLKHVSIASTSIMLAKIYMDSVKEAGPKIDPHLFDAAILAAVVKYGSVLRSTAKVE